MKVPKFFIFLLVLFVIAGLIYYFSTPRGNEIQLTGIVIQVDVHVSESGIGKNAGVKTILAGLVLPMLLSPQCRAAR